MWGVERVRENCHLSNLLAPLPQWVGRHQQPAFVQSKNVKEGSEGNISKADHRVDGLPGCVTDSEPQDSGIFVLSWLWRLRVIRQNSSFLSNIHFCLNLYYSRLVSRLKTCWLRSVLGSMRNF